MYKYFLFFILFLLFTGFTTSDTIPVISKGRIIPYGSLKKDQNFEHLNLSLPFLEEDEEKRANNILDVYQQHVGQIYKTADHKSLKYPSVTRLKAELLYSKIPFSLFTFFLYLFATFSYFLKKKNIFYYLLISAFFLHSFLLLLRTYILARPPVSNMNETLLYVPWIAIITALTFFIFSKTKSSLFLFASSILAMGLLFFNQKSPTLDNVQAVLDSRYWLIIHVLLVVGSYGVLLFSGVLAHIFLLNRRKATIYLEKTILQSLYLGTFLLICGTILGGIWAQESWGRFWDWDPKETWAFIASGVNLCTIHAYKFKKITSIGLSFGAIIGLMVISFTWYGVNYILGVGLHSYGFGSGGQWLYFSYLALEISFILLKKISLKREAKP
jgi:ABC-type transport system involved in cytochrome c biogenesis permease subunit